MKEMTAMRSGGFTTRIKYEDGECVGEELVDVNEVDEIHHIEVDGREFEDWDKAEAYARTGLTEIQRKVLDELKEQKGLMYAVMEEQFMRDGHANGGIREAMKQIGLEEFTEENIYKAIDRVDELTEKIGENLERHVKNNPEYADQAQNMERSKYVVGEEQ